MNVKKNNILPKEEMDKQTDAKRLLDSALMPAINEVGRLFENGRYFLSSPENKEWPIDTDANTAYNVARKGLLMVQSILRTTEKEKVNLGITNERWMKYIQCIS